MSKKKIQNNCVTLREEKRKHQYDDLYGSDTLSGTVDLFDHEDYKYIMDNKMSQLKEGAIPNPVGHTSFKKYYNLVIKLLSYQVHVERTTGLADMTT
jgi:hypothetical protein